MIFALLLLSGLSGPIAADQRLANAGDASEVVQWLAKLNQPQDPDLKLQPQNVVAKYETYDFAPLLKPRTVILGYIGTDYQRLHIVLTSVSRDSSDKRKYLVQGKSAVRDGANTFEGTITLDSAYEYSRQHYEVPDESVPQGIKSEGVLVGHYELKEDSAQAHSGTFNGIVTLYWYVDKDGRLTYDDIAINSDTYANNQYVGTWTSYVTGKEKVANWGEYRIPFSGDLNIGAGEFGPNPKYKDKGWADYDQNGSH